MSSPNHPTSDIEDAFSSNFLNYIPASPNYVPASPGNTYSRSSNNSFGLVPIASPTLSLFHDDPYMKVMQAYYAKELPISIANYRSGYQQKDEKRSQNDKTEHGMEKTVQNQGQRRLAQILGYGLSTKALQYGMDEKFPLG
ncbi:hypothetical protein Tco_1067099 [Tanacetum coccineum]|uniref:Uncharacterized protein n=1 Tax=Tanacetum coccineum TaxID=301880 RepID=A0ABQ5HBZ6_9ASTR